MSDPAVTVRVDDIHVGYAVFEDSGGGLKHLFSGERRRSRRIRAVRGVSFELHEGESLGIIGSNGSGKSTLLAAMTGLLPVESGEIWVRARPTLLGVGAVMRPSLSGRRNIIVGGLALGLSLAEIRSRMRDVIAFSGLEESIDLPMRTYSSGMRARLMFAIATATTPEILLIDEALAVGDNEFFQRSQRRIDEIRATAGTVVVVSHNLSELSRSCDRVIWLEKGELIADGDPEVVIAAYEAKVNGMVADQPLAGTPGSDPSEETTPPVDERPRRARQDRTVTLHIGTDFTVAPIQRYLRADDERIRHAGYSLPGFLRRRSHVDFVALGSENAAMALPVSFGGGDWASWRDEFARTARHQMDDRYDWVLSSEGFASRLGPSGIANLREFFESAGFDRVHAVLYLQRQDRLAARTHVLALESGVATPFDIESHLAATERYDWRRLIEWWSDDSVIDRLNVRLFPDRAAMPDLVEDFCQVTGLPRPIPFEWRPDPLLPTADAVSFIEHILDECEDRDIARSVGGQAVRALAAPSPEGQFSLTAAESRLLMGRFADANAWALGRVDPSGRVDDYFSAQWDLPVTRPELSQQRTTEFATTLAIRAAG